MSRSQRQEPRRRIFCRALPRLERAALPHCRPRRRRDLSRLHRAWLAGAAARFACVANHRGRPTRVPRDLRCAIGRAGGLEIEAAVPTYLTGSKALPWAHFSIRATFPSAPLRAAVSARTQRGVQNAESPSESLHRYPQGARQRRLHRGCGSGRRRRSMRLRERGWIAYRLRLEAEQHAWIATVIDWARRAA